MTRLLLTFLAAVGMLLAGGAASAQVPGGGSPLGPTIAIGHRGASAYAPEHTFAAYDLAMEQDVDMLECDLQLSADDVLVCVHDTTVDRTSDGTGRVDDFTLQELRLLDWGSWFDAGFAGAPIVPFEEQLDCYLAYNPTTRFHVETKGPDTYQGRMEELLVDLLDRKGLLDTGGVQNATILIQSFDLDSLELVRRLAPTLPTVFLFSAPADPSDPANPVAAMLVRGETPEYVDAVSPNFAYLLSNPTAVGAFHANGHEVHTYTVNDRPTMDQLVAMGVDGIFTNNPDLLRASIDDAGVGTSADDRGNPADVPDACPGVAGTVTAAPAVADTTATEVSGPEGGSDGAGDADATLAPSVTPSDAPAPDSALEVSPAPRPTLPSTGGGLVLVALVGLGAAAILRRR